MDLTTIKYETSYNPLAWIFVSYWDGQNKRRLLASDFANPERLKNREDIQINPHGVVLFRTRDLAEHFVNTKDN